MLRGFSGELRPFLRAPKAKISIWIQDEHGRSAVVGFRAQSTSPAGNLLAFAYNSPGINRLSNETCPSSKVQRPFAVSVAPLFAAAVSAYV